MSLTQTAFLNKANLPSKLEIEQSIRELGYDFKILSEFENLYGVKGIACTINGNKTFLEVHFNNPKEITAEYEFIQKDLENQDTAVSFIWGGDFAAGASIGLISVVLIDKCQALVYYLDDEIAYSKEMFLVEMPGFLNALEKETEYKEINKNRTTSLWGKIKRFWR